MGPLAGKWTDAKPASLSPQYQQAYLNGSANSLAVGMPINDVSAQLGDGWSTQPGVTDMQVVVDMLNKMIQIHYAGNDANLIAFRSSLAVFGTVGPTNAPTRSHPGFRLTVASVLTLLILFVLIVVGIFIFRRLRSEKPSKEAATPAATPVDQGIVEGGEVVMPAVSRAAGGARAVEKTAWPDESRRP